MTGRRIVPPAALLLWLAVGASSGDDAILQELTGQGIRLSTGQYVKLPPPSMADGLSAVEQGKIIRAIATRYPQDFLRHSRTARHEMRMEPVRDGSGDRSGQRIDLWFVAYGSLEALSDNAMLKEVQWPAGPKTARDLPSEARELTEDELKHRGLTVSLTDAMHQGYAFFNQSLLERVQISGVVYSVFIKSPGSIVCAAKLDSRFTGDAGLPNQWRSIKRDLYGKASFGPAQPYEGYGMYMKITPLVEKNGLPNGALFECHIAFDEPNDWFGGANLIRSKLPLAIPRRVQDFRRELEKAEDRRTGEPAQSAGRS